MLMKLTLEFQHSNDFLLNRALVYSNKDLLNNIPAQNVQ
jgi:hypothetical protein